MKAKGATTLRLQSCHEDLEVCQSMYKKIFGYTIDLNSTDEEFTLSPDFMAKFDGRWVETKSDLAELSTTTVKKEAPCQIVDSQLSPFASANPNVALKPDVLTLDHNPVEFENWMLCFNTYLRSLD